MKLTTVLLTVAFLSLSAKGMSQTVNFSGTAVPLEKVMTAVEQQTGYAFVYTENVVKGVLPVTIQAHNLPLEQFLQALFKDSPLKYTINNKTIFLSRKVLPSNSAPTLSQDTSIIIRGHVLDSKGNPLPGANVALKGTPFHFSTDADGLFVFSHVPHATVYTLEVTYLGFERYITSISVKDNHLNLTVSMKPSSSVLEETVVKGYYTTTNRLNTGSVSTVKAATIERQPVNDAMLALEGVVPGLYIQQSSGMPGSPVNVQIRGASSIKARSNPLYIIDGIPFDSNPVDQQNFGGGSQAGGTPNGGSDPLTMINPQDIESINILKDADATAIYGSRGANGVILITTKKGKTGKTHLNVNGFTGAGKVTRLLPLLNTQEYVDIRRKAFANDNIIPTADNAPDLLLWSQTDNVNYEKMLIGGTSQLSEVNAAISGGDKLTTFLLGGTYHHETMVTPSDSRYQRANVNMKVDHTSADGRFKVNMSAIYSTDNNLIYGPDLTNVSTTYPNNYPMYDDHGQLYWGGGFSNPMALLKQSFKTNTESMLLNASLSYNILQNLQVKVNVGENKIELDQKILYPGSTYNPVYQNTGTGYYSSNSTKNYLVEPQINYHTTLGAGKLDAIVGGSWQQSKYNQPYFVIAADFPTEALMDSYGAAGTIYVNTSTTAEYKYASVLSRLSYTWKDKYVLNGTFRRDGSSRFGPNKRFGNFGSLGAAWIFSDESFLQHQNWLSYGKLRASYGTVGNDQIPNYAYLSTYSISPVTYGPTSSFVPTGVANPDFSWERSNKLEAAMDLGFLHNQLQFTGAWYRNRTGNMLANYTLSPQSGFSSYTANLNALVQSQGVEIEVKGAPIDHKNFSWNLSFNISAYKNKLLSFPGLANSSYANTYVIGQSLNMIGLYHLTGFKDGQATVEDVNKDGVITPGLFANGQGDYIVAGSRDPKYYGGISNSIRFKQFQLDMLFNFVKQQNYAVTAFPGLLSNQYRDVLNSPFTPASQASSPSYNSYINYFLSSDGKLTDASFIRLKNISLSYTLPDQWRKMLRMASCRVYLRGQNLITFTKYRGFDPETNITPGVSNNPYVSPLSTPTLPTLKMVIAGIQFSY
ncbi:SusC/RagA family TonB-linked outer membrane protein [Chitinophaga sp. 30R24]|uniref:SusC/RagA family TonB-linked outer membrane protein n=1 Tax=Chitinophaga sp. 30R24 TaxID=3248838 RepID=UPI003B90C622